jgi:hypothetical protein
MTQTFSNASQRIASLRKSASSSGVDSVQCARSKDGRGPKLSLEAVLMLWRTHLECKVVQKGLAQDKLAQLFETDLPSSMLWLETGHEGAGLEHIRCEHETGFTKIGLSCTEGVSLGMAGTNGN